MSVLKKERMQKPLLILLMGYFSLCSPLSTPLFLSLLFFLNSLLPSAFPPFFFREESMGLRLRWYFSRVPILMEDDVCLFYSILLFLVFVFVFSYNIFFWQLMEEGVGAA